MVRQLFQEGLNGSRYCMFYCDLSTTQVTEEKSKTAWGNLFRGRD